ncbi:MAG: hypothetical protein JWM57_1059 [Phycisphaerales bacterium]|nr:hypothetical protein [Phycisphaerales bacterium]
MFIAEATPASNLTDIIVPFVPWLIVFVVVLGVMIPLQRKRQQKVGNYLERMRQHMDAVERKLDRLIELNERPIGR